MLLYLSEAAWMLERFADHFGKNKWIELTKSDLRKYPELASEFIGLVNHAYANIGGHFELKTPEDLFNGDVALFKAIDVDDDGEADAVVMRKVTSWGEKGLASGQDGGAAAKKASLDVQASDMKGGGVYSEMSDAVAHVMLTRYNVPSVNSKEAVERVLGKTVEWVGPHPDGKYPENPGWYIRNVSGHRHMKILLGTPTGVR